MTTAEDMTASRVQCVCEHQSVAMSARMLRTAAELALVSDVPRVMPAEAGHLAGDQVAALVGSVIRA